MNPDKKKLPSLYSLSTRRDRQRFYGWLRSVNRIEDLLQPNTASWWGNLTVVQKRHIKLYALDRFGEEARERFKQHLKLQRRAVKAKKKLTNYVKDKEFVASMNRELSDHSQVVQFLPASALSEGVLFLRHVGISPETVAKTVGVRVSEVNQIATPEALEDFAKKMQQGRDTVLQFIEGRAIADLLTAQSKGLSVRENLAVLRLLGSLQTSKSGGEKGANQAVTGQDKRRLEEITKRHAMYSRSRPNEEA